MDKDTLEAIESIKNLLLELFEAHPFKDNNIDYNFKNLYDILKRNQNNNSR